MATAKKIKRPAMKRYPKRPKSSATLEAWKRFDAKCKEVEKENKTRMDHYNKMVREQQSAKKAKEQLMKKTEGLRGIAYKGK